MRTFKLRFQLNFEDEVTGDSVKSGHYSLIIKTDSPDSACLFGERLLGRHVYERERLAELILVEEIPAGDQQCLQSIKIDNPAIFNGLY